MKVTCISDTHNYHDKIKIEETDILIHSGDATGRGSLSEIKSFFSWFERQPSKWKIYVAGNHDFLPQEDPSLFRMLLAEHPQVIYLENSEVMVEGIRIYGSPITPRFYDWAFNADSPSLKETWQAIPSGIDILITHGPPFEILDETDEGVNAGCKILLHEIQTRIKPKYHLMGHIHEGYGSKVIGGVTFINASSCNRKYQPVNPPIIFEI